MKDNEELPDELVAVRAELAVCNTRLRDMYASTSWRITAPLRVLGRQVRRLTGPSCPAALPPETHLSESAAAKPEDALSLSIIYDFAAHIADRSGCSRVIDVGCRHAQQLASLFPRFHLTAVGSRADVDRCKSHCASGEWIVADFEAESFLPSDRLGLRESIVICSDAFGPALNPKFLLRTLRDLLEDAPFAVVATSAQGDFAAFTALLESVGLEIMFGGLTAGNCREAQRDTIVVVARKPQPVLIPPPHFRVAAFMSAYNEEDVIGCTLEHLIAQGMEVHLIDNWSTDRTVVIASESLGHGVRTITRFPETGPTGTYDHHDFLLHVEALAQASDADWILVNDADEIRESPWPRLTLREALYQVDQAGFNAIDYTALDFPPTGAPFFASALLQSQFRYFEFGTRPGHFRLIKGWKRQPGPVEFAWSGGHEVRFPGRLVYPFKFLLRHYPIRTQEQGERKVFVDRLPRFNPFDKQVRGWHIQYDGLSQGQSFVRDPATLLRFDDVTFYHDYLVERLSGVGVVR